MTHKVFPTKLERVMLFLVRVHNGATVIVWRLSNIIFVQDWNLHFVTAVWENSCECGVHTNLVLVSKH